MHAAAKGLVDSAAEVGGRKVQHSGVVKDRAVLNVANTIYLTPLLRTGASIFKIAIIAPGSRPNAAGLWVIAQVAPW